jgi:hypothetical protein
VQDKQAPISAPSKAGQGSDNKSLVAPAAEDESLAFLKNLAEASALFVGFTFIGGWSYLASYYRTFGLNAQELDLPLPVVCTTAIYVLFNARWPLFVVAVLWIGWIFFSRLLTRFRRSVTAVALAILLLTVPIAGALHGRQRATEDMLIDSSELPNVAFSSKLVRTDQPNCVDHETYGSADCKLLLHLKGTYYFFTPIPKQEDAITSTSSLNIYTLADPDVSGIHILRGLERNAREK